MVQIGWKSALLLAFSVFPGQHSLRVPSEVAHESLLERADHLLEGVAGSLEKQLVDAEEAAYALHDGKLVVVTSANGRYTNLTLNLYLSMTKVLRNKLVVFCEDAECKRALHGRGMQIVETGNGFAESGSYDSPMFNMITGRKPTYVYWFLQRNYTVLWTDSDVAWINDPIPALDSTNISFVVQDDSKLGQHGVPVTAASENRKANTGFFWVRPSKVGKSLMAGWLLSMGSSTAKVQDQRAFQPVFRSNCKDLCVEELEACHGEPDCLILSRGRCPNGSVKKWRWTKDAWAYHANWHDGAARKEEQMHDKGLWLLEDPGQK